MKSLKVTKFFDVKTPIGFNQRLETAENYSIGSDLYMPKDTEQFRSEFLKVNGEIYKGLQMNVSENSERRITEFVYPGHIGDYSLMRIETDLKENKSEFNIYQNCQIPSGIGFLLDPVVWLEVRSKSSNFKNSFTVVHGTVDHNYTYGVGIQLILLADKITLESDQKIAQVVLHKAEAIEHIEEIKLDSFESLDEVKNYRKKRIGGFGSTGVFDNNIDVIGDDTNKN